MSAWVGGDPAGSLNAPARAAFIGCAPILRQLLARGADVKARSQTGATAIMYAVELSDPAIIHLLADAGADVNAACEDGHTALMFAVAHGEPAVVEALLERGADVNARDAAGVSVLGRIREKNPEIAEILLAAGAAE